MADHSIWRLACVLDLIAHEFKDIGKVITFLSFVDVVVDELVVGEASKEMALAILVDFLEELEQISSLGVEQSLKFSELDGVKDRALLVPALQQSLDDALQ